MPKQYETIRDQCFAKIRSKGRLTPEDLADCKTKAAKIYNAARPKEAAPVTGKHAAAPSG